MFVTEFGFALALITGVSLGFVGFAILLFWIQLFNKSFDSESQSFWPLFWAHMIFWIVGTCVVSVDWLNETIGSWGWPALIFFMVSLVAMAISKISKLK